jgi:hypothetical protein
VRPGVVRAEPLLLLAQTSSEGDLARVTDRPCCVNLVLDFAPDERLEVVVEERVP